MGAIQRLYQATEAAQELEAMLLEAQGDITELEGQFDILTRQSGSLSSCIDDVLSLVRDIEARAEAREAEAKRLKERAARDEKVAAWMKAQVLRVMQAEGMKKIETERWRATVAMPGGKAALEIVDEVPEEFTTTVTKIIPDNERIRAALETGTLPFARIVPKEPYLKVS